MRSDADIEDAIKRYADMVYRIGLMYLHNKSDAEDVFQDVFLKYALSARSFEGAEHTKAWLLRVAVNACKSRAGSTWKKVRLTDDAALLDDVVPEAHRDVWQAVRELPRSYRAAVYLHYFEGYKAKEIGKILGKRENTVYSLLGRAREKLRAMLGEDEDV